MKTRDRGRAARDLSRLTPRRRQAGSAYVITLIALVVMTIVGLSLSLITQTEMRVGANERVVQRVFYAADAGIAAGTSRALVNGDYTAHEYTIADPDAGPALNMRHQISISPYFTLQDDACNLCDVAARGDYEGDEFKRITYGVASVARRVAGAGDTRLAEKTVSTMLEVQPWRSSTDSYAAATEPTELAKIKF